MFLHIYTVIDINLNFLGKENNLTEKKKIMRTDFMVLSHKVSFHHFNLMSFYNTIAIFDKRKKKEKKIVNFKHLSEISMI